MQLKFPSEKQARSVASDVSKLEGYGLITIVESRGEFFVEDGETYGMLRNWEREVALYRDGREVDRNDQPI